MWNGNIGTLIANARKNAPKARNWNVGEKPPVPANWVSTWRSKAPFHGSTAPAEACAAW